MKATTEKGQKVLQLIAGKADVEIEELKPTDKWADIGLDSLDVVELLMEVEDQLGFRFSEDDQSQMATIGDVLKYVEAH